MLRWKARIKLLFAIIELFR